MSLTNLLKGKLPTNWIEQSDEVVEVPIIKNSSEYNQIKSELSGEPLTQLKMIARIQNPYLYHRYQLKKKEYQVRGIVVREMSLLHATAASKVQSIITNNLDWRLVSRSKFGKGVSFTPSAVYANKECSHSNGTERAILVTKVLVGNLANGSSYMTLPPKGSDTTVGNRNSVYVKYYDDEFLPQYVAYYDLPTDPRLNKRRRTSFYDDLFDFYDLL